jgi:23S rRNA (uracil-5-)-methyltransferase RumA
MISNKKFKALISQKAADYRNNNTDKLSPKSEYFGEIGSIPIEDIPYADQLSINKSVVTETLSKVLPEEIISDYEIVASPDVYEYRFRMDYVCSYNPIHEPHNRIGQRKAKSFNWIVDMENDVLLDKQWFKKVRSVYKKAQELEIENYDVYKHTGNLRYLVIRQQKEIGMLNIVTKLNEQKLIHELMQFAYDIGFKSVNWIHHPGINDSSEGEVIETLGSKTITIQMSNHSFMVGPDNFFQNNINAFELIIDSISEHLDKTERTEDLIDLYSGVGTLGIVFAKYFKNIHAVEINPRSVLIAKSNAELNNIENYIVETHDISRDGIQSDLKKNQTVIVDPPRTGLEEKGLNDLMNLSPRLIIYISCNPVTQAQDTLTILENGYTVVQSKAFDLFPHTYHVENVIIFEKLS